MENNSKYLRTQQVAELLDLNRATVLRWLKEGKLPGICLSLGKRRVWRIRESSLNEWLEEREKTLKQTKESDI